MAIYNDSRYAESTVDYFSKKENGVVYPLISYTFDELESITFTVHTYSSGETLQGISTQYYQNPALWWAIAEYNPEIKDLLNIDAGTLLRIPNV
jgi:nucleoid-associated protein YgaU